MTDQKDKFVSFYSLKSHSIINYSITFTFSYHFSKIISYLITIQFAEIVSVCHKFFSTLNDTCSKYLNQGNGKLSHNKSRKLSKDSQEEGDETPVKNKKKRIKKPIDPNAPKKPATSPWILYYKERREPLQKEYPGTKPI